MLKVLNYLVIAFPLATALNFFPADSRAEVLTRDGYDLATTADDGTIYLGKINKVINGMTFIDFIAFDDPDNDGKEYTFMEVFKCSDGTFKHSASNTWKKTEPGSIGAQMMRWACP